MDIKSITSEAELRKLLKKQSELFFGISKLDEKRLSVSELLNRAVHIIERSWLYPDGVMVAIYFGKQSFFSEHFKKTEWSLKKDSDIRGKFKLTLELFSSEERSFFEEEQELASVIAENLSAKVQRILSKEELEAEQELLDKAYKLAHIGTWEYDMINDELHWSDVTKEVHGFGPDYNPDVESTIELFKEGYNRDAFAKAAEDAIEKEIPFNVELKIISGQGDERWIRATGEPEYRGGECIRFYGISQNVTSRRQAEEDLEFNERRFKAMVQHGMDMIAVLDKEANYKYVSPASENVLGLKPSFFEGKNAFDLIHDDDKERIEKQYSDLKFGESIQISPFRFQDVKGQWRWVEATLTNLMNDPAIKGYIANSRDITERQIKQEQIVDALKEKETLLAEVHHRVKNNLSVLTGLLQLQASKESNEEVLKRLFDSVARIHTMASIHEQLYKTKDFSEIELGERIRLLAMNIKKSYQSETEVDIDIQTESLKTSINRALPCSLIANEVLTNIFKHAFKGRKKGNIKVELNRTDVKDFMQLKISDDGVGLPEDFDPKESDSLGLSLIDMLSEQIKAKYIFDSNDSGASFILLFKPQN